MTSNMANWRNGLSTEQKEIVEYPGPFLQVLGGAGAGKSLALKRRVARLLEEGEPAGSILAVTFTRTAANDLRADLHGLEISGCHEIDVSTLHGLCFRILWRRGVLEVTGRTPRPLLEFETRYLLLDLPADPFGGMRERRKSLKAFEAAWARLQNQDPGWPPTEIDRHFQDHLLRWLRFHDAMLIGELVPETWLYLRNNPACPERRIYKHILVDEYQDLNRAEQELVRFLADQPLSGEGTLTVAGDGDQCIYGFKHSHPEGMIEFPALYPGTHCVTLVDCRRCPTTVVQIANSFLSQGRSTKLLQEDSANGLGAVHIVQWNSLDEEARGLAQLVALKVATKEVETARVLVLTPRRLIGYKIRDALQELGIPVRSCFYEEALESEAAQERFALLTVVVNPHDRVALRALLGIGSSDGRVGAYVRLRSHCEATGESPWRALERLADGSLHLPYAGGLVARFVEIRRELEDLGGLPLQNFLSRWLPPGLSDMDELCTLTQQIAPAVTTVKELYEELRTRITQPELPGQQDRVYVMSLHKAKGLTADMVVVAGCVEGLIPYVDQDETPQEQARQLEEQDRLFFVALTRTRQVLVLSSALRVARREAQRMRARYSGSGYIVATIASRFLAQLGPRAPLPRRGESLLPLDGIPQARRS